MVVGFVTSGYAPFRIDSLCKFHDNLKVFDEISLQVDTFVAGISRYRHEARRRDHPMELPGRVQQVKRITTTWMQLQLRGSRQTVGPDNEFLLSRCF